MASKDDQVGDFFELRHGFEALSAFAGAALRFLDLHGIALGAPRIASSNGASAHVQPREPQTNPTLREKVKRHYTARRAAATNGHSAAKKAAKKPSLNYSAKRRAARAHSATLLAGLDRDEPRQMVNPADRIHMGSLIRRGYAKKKGDGYILTAKGAKGYDEGAQTDGDPSDAGGAVDITVKEAARILGMSESNVRLMIKAHKLSGRTDFRARAGFTKPVKTVVLDREEVGRYAAEINA